jgi:SAM-dependent methyltransferase
VTGDDAFGRALIDWVEGRGDGRIVLEREDKFVFHDSVAYYAAPFRSWEPQERQALRLARGRVLDVGCGIGRVSLELQKRGRNVVGIDISPLVVESARRRGVEDARLLPLEAVDESLGAFDTIILYGNNLGLLGSTSKGRRLLRRLHSLTTPRGRILGASMDIGSGEDDDHRDYFERNVRRGRLRGQARLRVRYRTLVGPWFDWLFLSKPELEQLAASAGWHVRRYVDAPGARYVAVLEKD